MTVTIATSSVDRLATRLENDISYRQLGPGDRYMTADEAGQMLGVSLATANRAMQLLAKRDILVRRRSHGTFIGSRVDMKQPSQLRTIHFLLPADRSNCVTYDELAEGVSREVSLASVQFTRLPRDNTVHFVRDLIDRAAQAGNLLGVIAGSCPHGVYRYLQDQAVPAVVLGSLYRDTDRLPSLDVDMRQAGRLMAEYLIARGHKRIALLAREQWSPGDNMFFESVTSAMSAAGLSHDSLVVRSMVDQREPAVHEVRHLLESDGRPTGFICRRRFFVQAVKTVAESLGLSVPDDVAIVVDGPSSRYMAGLNVPCCLPELDITAMTGVLTRMLCELSEGREPETPHVVVPCTLTERSVAASA